MQLKKSFKNVHWLFDPVMNGGLMMLMDCFSRHKINVELRRAVKSPVTGKSAAITLTINDAEIKGDATSFAKDVHFRLERWERNGRVQARAIADVSEDRRQVCNLLDADQCEVFADGLLQMLRSRGIAAKVPALPPPDNNP